MRATRDPAVLGSLIRLLVGCLLALAAPPLRAQTDLAIYTDALQNSWADWSYIITEDQASTVVVHGGAKAIRVVAQAWGALSLEHDAIDTSSYTNLSFWINGGPTGGQKLQVYAELSSGAKPAVTLAPLATNTWQSITLSLTALGVANQPDFTRFSLQDRSGTGAAAFFVDDITLVGMKTMPVTNLNVTISIDAAANRHPIDSLVYGVAFASASQLNELNFTVNRSGGNNETRYNWQLNAHNLDADWYFESYPDSSATSGAAADDFVTQSRNGGAAAMITIPMIGWAPKLGPGRTILPSYSVAKYGPQTAVDPYLHDAGNGRGTNAVTHTSWLIVTNDPGDANIPVTSAFQAGYVQHLLTRWGASGVGGVRFYIMDNEHSLWHETHRDVHPIGPTMREMRDRIIEYGSMVKSNDPNALVCAPEEWGWPGYFNSGYDLQNSGQRDRGTNGGWDYMPWLLDQLHKHDLTQGRRLLDYFTLHCYPQSGEFGSDVSKTMQLLRNRSTRQFWDTNYVDASWINDKVKLIPRMKDWVARYYPGTRIGVTEYNWGAETNMNGATAQADLLGIFGREGLDLSTRWTTPDAASTVFQAMKLYRNYDGQRSTFGDTSVSATVSTNVDLVSAFAAVRSSDGALTVIVVNKQLAAGAALTLATSGFQPAGLAQAWQVASNQAITRLPDAPLSGPTLNIQVPAQCITLFVLPGPPRLVHATMSGSGTLGFTLNGQAGLRYLVQSSTDLIAWTPVRTNTLTGVSLDLSFAAPDQRRFYRALQVP